MGSISSPWDNAAMESLMGIVRAECVHALTYATREEAALDLFEYIEVVYNRQFKLSAARLVLEGEIPVKGLSDQLNVPCCTLRRWAAE